MYLQQRTVNNTIPESSYVGIYRAYLLSFPRAIQVSRYVTAYSLCDKADVLGAIVKEAPSTILTAKTQIGTRHCTVWLPGMFRKNLSTTPDGVTFHKDRHTNIHRSETIWNYETP